MERFRTQDKGTKRDTLPIKGFLPSGMLDWPGRMAATLFLEKCNFRCPFCHNGDLVLSGKQYKSISKEQVIAYLLSRKKWIDALVITGGEPTLSKGLENFIKRLKGSGFDIKLDTNGSKPKVLKSLYDSKLIDFVAMDIKTEFKNYPRVVEAPVDIEAIKESISFLASLGIGKEFRMTVVPGLITESTARNAALQIKKLGANKLVLQQFQNKSTLDPGYENVEPYNQNILHSIAQAVSEHLEVEIRGI